MCPKSYLRLALLVPLSVVAAAAGPTEHIAHALPQLGADAPVDAPLTGRKPGTQKSSAIAFGGGVYLNVWIDGTWNPSGGQTVLAARTDASGAILDDPPIEVHNAGGAEDTPAVAFDGANFLVVWKFHDSGPSGDDIYGCYIDATGTVKKAAFTIATGDPTQVFPAVAGGDGHALVVWSGDEPVKGGVYNTHGALFDDKMAFVASTKTSPIIISTFTLADGGVLDPPAVAWGGAAAANNFLVAWDYGSPGFRAIYAATVDKNGVVAAPACPIPGSCPTINAPDFNTAVSMDAAEPAIATDGVRYLVTWTDQRNDPGHTAIFGRFVPFDISMLAAQMAPVDFPIADGMSAPNGGTAFQRSELAYVSGQYVSVYESASNITSLATLVGNRIDAMTGMSIDGMGGIGVPISTAPAQGVDILPNTRRTVLATDGTKVFLAWTDQGSGYFGSDTYVLPIDPSKALVASDSKLVSAGRNVELGRSVATNGDVALIVWEDTRNSHDRDIYGMRVDPKTGMPTEKPFVICNAPGEQFAPSVAAYAGMVGSEFLVVWSDGRNLDTGMNGELPPVEIYASRIGSTGAPMDPNGFIIRNAPGAARLSPAVAASDTGWYVAWEDWQMAEVNTPLSEVWGTVVGKDGKYPKETKLAAAATSSKDACAPAVVWNGTKWFVAYEQPCSQTVDGATNPDLFGAWVGADGAWDQVTVPLATQPATEAMVQLAAGDNGQILLVWRAGTPLTTTQEIDGAVLANGASAITANSFHKLPLVSAQQPVSPSITWIASTVPGTGRALVTWSQRDRLMGVRTDASFNFVEDPFPLPPTLTPVVKDTDVVQVTLGAVLVTGQSQARIDGAFVAGTYRSVPPVAIAATPLGDVVLAYDVLETLAHVGTPRVHFNRMGALPSGATCNGKSACADGICTGGFCCNTTCDGVCQRCGVNGCNQAPPTDSRCGASGGGAISCSALSTTCRSYRDLQPNECAYFGQCAEAANLAECTRYVNATDGTACPETTCDSGGAVCQSGGCVCPGQKPLTFDPRLPVGGCALSPRAPSPSALALLCLALGMLLLRRRRR